MINPLVGTVYTVEYNVLSNIITYDELDELFPEVHNDTYVKFYLDRGTDLDTKVTNYLFSIGIPDTEPFILINFSW